MDNKSFRGVELNDEDLEQVTGGNIGRLTADTVGYLEGLYAATGSKKGWGCKNCGNIDGTWEEGTVAMMSPSKPIRCFNCGAMDSFEKRDI